MSSSSFSRRLSLSLSLYIYIFRASSSLFFYKVARRYMTRFAMRRKFIFCLGFSHVFRSGFEATRKESNARSPFLPRIYKRELARDGAHTQIKREREKEPRRARTFFLLRFSSFSVGANATRALLKERNILLLQKRYLSFRFKDTEYII